MPPFPPEFLETIPYAPDAFLFDELIEVAPERRSVTARLHTDKPLPLLEHQRETEAHPRHLPGGLIVHLTGMIGIVYAYYLLGARFDEGWTSYGARIYKAEFRELVDIGPPIELELVETRVKTLAGRINSRCDLTLTQGDRVCYRGDQLAVTFKP